MTETDCSYYFLSKTAIQLWQKDDVSGQNRMYECLAAMYKESFFKQVIFKSKTVPEYRLVEIAENVFITTWLTFNTKGKAGEIEFKSSEYTGFFYTIFKRNYIKFSEKEVRQADAEKEFGNMHTAESEMAADKDDIFSSRTQRTLHKISPDCKQLLIWKHIEGLSHDEIAKRKNINRISSIKMVSRCGRRFLAIWRLNKN